MSIYEKIAIMTTKANVIRVANVLCSNAVDGKVMNMKQIDIANFLRTSKWEVSKAIGELSSLGLIKAERIGNKYTYYILDDDQKK
ncbi:helix-turn-helix domain-containing protein [Pelosinus propionicus]|uniref:HTH crp-type domain-containing protein n=1 Tax=Pelosinus propionicus DSM 13327 TaxID=1123291 RepID=A0A1I4PT36_9FIRM|nr:helix-turn-helix domain-containing protein [Pelosinus propionicus]SFM31011.1 hypothetical protein SAMN04490355_107220 [Pelosinus propionicus DSM 13327]